MKTGRPLFIGCAASLGVAAALAAPPTGGPAPGPAVTGEPAPIDMVLGRMVPARADAPSAGTTRHVRAHYVLHCGGCHGMDGAGSQLGGVPSLKRLGEFLRVSDGRDFVIKVPGVMGSGLTDAQVAEVTNWVLATLARGSVPLEHRPYDAEEVRRARAQPIVDVAAERSRLVREARERGVDLY
jgi:mono/diheme cytochrome c family protein